MADEPRARDENMIAALKRERAGYVAQGKDDRVAQVDEQLRHYGHVEQAPATDPDGGPKGRTSPEETKRTAESGGKAPAAKRAARPPQQK